MTPDYKILANDNDFTEEIRNRFISLTIQDNAGIESDSITLVLSDHDFELNIPPSGAKLKAFMGYKGEPLVYMGQYVMDNPVYTFAPNKLTLTGKAADVYLGSKQKVLKTRSYHKKTLGEIVNTVADNMGLKASISSELATIKIHHIDQTDESNLHFLTRLAKKYDATTKPAGGKLVFIKKGAALSASGKKLPSQTISIYDIQPNAKWQQDGRNEYDGVTASWHDKDKAKKQTVTVGGENRKKVRGTFGSKEEAQAAANAELKRIKRDPASFNCTLKRGNPTIRAETHIKTNATFLKKQLVGKRWLVERCTHTLNKSSGYTTSITTKSGDV